MSGNNGDVRAGKGWAAFLVLAWLEEREVPGAEPAFRARLSDLLTGERRYFDNPQELIEGLRAKLDQAGLSGDPQPGGGPS